jgi:hypothetical protein
MIGIGSKLLRRFEANPSPQGHPPPLGRSPLQDLYSQGRPSHSDLVDAAMSSTLTKSIAVFEDKTLILGVHRDHTATIVVCTSTTTQVATTTKTETITLTVTQRATAIPLPVTKNIRPTSFSTIFYSLVRPIFSIIISIMSIIVNLVLQIIFSLFSFYGLLFCLCLLCLTLYLLLSSDQDGSDSVLKDFLAALFTWGRMILFQNTQQRRHSSHASDSKPRRVVARPLSMTQRANVVNRGPPIGDQLSFQQGSKSLTHISSADDQLPARPSHRSSQLASQQGLGPPLKEIASDVPTPQLAQAFRQPVAQPGATAGPSATQVLGDVTPPYRPRASLYTRALSSYANRSPDIPEETVGDSENEESDTDFEQVAKSDSVSAPATYDQEQDEEEVF